MDIVKAKQDIINYLNQNMSQYTDMADQIWENPEVKWEEFFASQLQANFLENEGFSVTRDVVDMNTAFIAEWGTGPPIIGFIGEYDALPGLSQKKQSSQRRNR